MTRQSPDRLDHGSEHYHLYPCLSLLPLGHPRWDHCRFAWGDSTANYRGYGARWMVKDRHLYLKSLGGSAEEGDGFGRRDRQEGPRRAIGMVDVHEVDVPVPARWISCDLWCPAGRAEGSGWSDFVPERFVLFRVVRGVVVAEMSVPNVRRVVDVDFRHGTSLLDGLVAREGGSPSKFAAAAVKGLATALEDPGEGTTRRRVAAMLWTAGVADLGVLISALSTIDDPDVLRWIGYAIAAIGPNAADAVPHIMRVLFASAEPDVVQAMAYALGGIGMPAAPAFKIMIPVVEAGCGRKADDQILHFADNLASAGQEAIDVLIAGMLASRSSSVASRISWLLGEMGLTAVLPLYSAFLAAKDEGQRSSLAQALGRIGPGASLVLGALLDTLRRTQDDDVRFLVAEAVARIGLRSPASLLALRPAFRSARDDRALRVIADAAASLGSEAVGFLVQEFEVVEEIGKLHIARVLGEIGIDAGAAAGPLAAAADTSSSCRLVLELAASLKKIAAPDGVVFKARMKALQCDPYGHWTQAVLGDMQFTLDAGLRLPDRDVWNLVTLLVEAGESPTGRCVAKMLGTVGKAAAEPLLIALDRVRDRGARVVIFHALGQVGEPAQSATDDAVAALSAAADDRMRLQIVDDLVRLGRPDEKHMATLAEVLIQSSFLPVWWRLGLVLASFGAPAVPTLVRILDHASNEELCRAMENALSETAASDAATDAALLTAIRGTTRPQTIKALQAALDRSAQR